MTNHTDQKRCTSCGDTKPLTEFYLRNKMVPSKGHRSLCKACMSDYCKERYRRGPSVPAQVIRHTVDPSAPLSPEAEKAIYTTTPIDPDLLRLYQSRLKAGLKRDRATQRRIENQIRPMRFSKLEAAV